MTDLERLRGNVPRQLPPRGGAAAVRQTARRRLNRLAAVTSSALVVVALLVMRAGSLDGASGLDVVTPAAPTTSTLPAGSPAPTPSPSTPPPVVPDVGGGGGPEPVQAGDPAPVTDAAVPAPDDVRDVVDVSPPPPSSAAPAAEPKMPPGENMPRTLVDRGAAACSDPAERSTTFCGRVATSVGADRVVTITTEVCAAAVNMGDPSLTYSRELETDVVAHDGDTELWRFSRGRMWDATAHVLPLDAGQCYVWTTTWVPVDGDGAPLPAGTYDVTAVSFADEVSGANTWSAAVVLP